MEYIIEGLQFMLRSTVFLALVFWIIAGPAFLTGYLEKKRFLWLYIPNILFMAYVVGYDLAGKQ